MKTILAATFGLAILLASTAPTEAGKFAICSKFLQAARQAPSITEIAAKTGTTAEEVTAKLKEARSHRFARVAAYPYYGIVFTWFLGAGLDLSEFGFVGKKPEFIAADFSIPILALSLLKNPTERIPVIRMSLIAGATAAAHLGAIFLPVPFSAKYQLPILGATTSLSALIWDVMAERRQRLRLLNAKP